MSEHVFDVTLFRQEFPQFADEILYPDETLQQYWNVAIIYFNRYDNCLICGDQLQYALNILTAHIADVTGIAKAGGMPGFIDQASIDKVSVALLQPPVSNFFQFWLSSSPYGQQLLALLKTLTVGGFTIGGLPEIGGIRKVGGIF